MFTEYGILFLALFIADIALIWAAFCGGYYLAQWHRWHDQKCMTCQYNMKNFFKGGEDR